MSCCTTMSIDKPFAGFGTVSLDEIRAASLLRRRDVKYLLREDQLADILPGLSSYYRILDTAGQQCFRYATHYFDTTDFSCYHDHHNGRLERCKIRVREYCDSDAVFAEVKKRHNTGETVKSRIRCNSVVGPADPGFAELIRKETALDPCDLVPSVSIRCVRNTLVDFAFSERVTIDRELGAFRNKREMKCTGLVILEIKRRSSLESSAMASVLNRYGIAPVGYSKYCMAVAALCNTVKKNRFKPKQMHIARLLSKSSRLEVVV